MKQNKNQMTEANYRKSLIKPLLIGAGIGLILISLFVFGGEPKPEWGRFWRVKPLIMVPLAGSFGGIIYYFIDQLVVRKGLNKTVATLLSLVIFVIVLWIGAVLGLNGTMWD